MNEGLRHHAAAGVDRRLRVAAHVEGHDGEPGHVDAVLAGGCVETSLQFLPDGFGTVGVGGAIVNTTVEEPFYPRLLRLLARQGYWPPELSTVAMRLEARRLRRARSFFWRHRSYIHIARYADRVKDNP